MFTSNIPAIFRGMLRDVVHCSEYEQTCKRMGMVPASPEVDHLEHRNSHARIRDYAEIEDGANTYADLAAEVVLHLAYNEDDEAFEDIRDTYHHLARIVSAEVVSHLLEDGTLQIAD